MSKTPRTDAKQEGAWNYYLDHQMKENDGIIVPVAFARQLERELAGFCSELKADTTLAPSGMVVDAMLRLQAMKRELLLVARRRDELLRDRNTEKQMRKDSDALADDMRQERDAAIRERDQGRAFLLDAIRAFWRLNEAANQLSREMETP